MRHCGSVGLQMGSFFFFSFFSFTPPTFVCKDNIYVFLLGTENAVGGGGIGPLLSVQSSFGNHKLGFPIPQNKFYSENLV